MVKNRSNISAVAVALVTSVTLSPAYCGAALAATTKPKPPRPHLQMEQPKEALPPPSPDPGASSPAESKAGQPAQETYPVIGQLEMVTFGSSKPQLHITDRLSQLEQAIYHQTYPNLSLSERSQRLKDTLLGPSVDPDIRMGGQPEPAPFSQPRFPERRYPPNPTNSMPTGAAEQGGIDPRLLETWKQPFFQTPLPRNELEHFALELVNRERADMGLAQLQWDDVSQRVAVSLVDDLCLRDTVSHLNKAGENPDVRYTRAGGNDALSESLVTVTGPFSQTLNRALVARMVEELKSHQDDRDSLMSPDATHFAFSLAIAQPKDKAIGCAEVVTKHAIMHPIPEKLKVGDKIEVKGVLLQPYRFQKVTLAWEGNLPESQSSPADSDVPQDEAMPYFPPLDYVAYASRAEHDREKLATILRTTGVIAAVAGGMFMPPVALAAPLIAMAPVGSSEPRAAADVPVHGGIKVQGSTFFGNVPVSHQGKEGLYYLTVWAAASELGRPVPISRRTIVVKTTAPAVTTTIPIDPPVVFKQNDPDKVDREKQAGKESSSADDDRTRKEAAGEEGGSKKHSHQSTQASSETEPVRGGQPGSL